MSFLDRFKRQSFDSLPEEEQERLIDKKIAELNLKTQEMQLAARDLKSANREEARRRRQESVGKIMNMAGKTVPKGIKHPDSLVRNQHLYYGGTFHKGKLFNKKANLR